MFEVREYDYYGEYFVGTFETREEALAWVESQYEGVLIVDRSAEGYSIYEVETGECIF